MVPPPGRSGTALRSAPRAHGDGPTEYTPAEVTKLCSPRTRGWSHGGLRSVRGPHLLPAHAGMVPRCASPAGPTCSAPRARGDGPQRDTRRRLGVFCSRARGDGPGMQAALVGFPACSSRTRGWSPPARPRAARLLLLPAHAGMVPSSRRMTGVPAAAPRARGDGPNLVVICGPRLSCSPHMRGWSYALPCLSVQKALLPAHAGIVPRLWPTPSPTSSAPRARGGGPRRHRYHPRRSPAPAEVGRRLAFCRQNSP
ncbi:hypothetical protein SAMN05428939_8119 [Streptomyces sp. TLI_105]|nr:hypothetical protein SAMN05428939_8119 [Streptomyces sp. TLI_105]